MAWFSKLCGRQSAQIVVADAPASLDSHENTEEVSKQLTYEDFLADNPIDRMPHGHTRRKKSVLIWNPPKEVDYPAAVSEAELFQVQCKDVFGRNVAGKFFFYPNEGSVLEAGLWRLEVIFIPENDNKFKGCQETRELLVRKRKPITNWTLSFDEIVYRTPLGPDVYAGLTCELNGGSWEYSHALGDVLSVGRHKLCAEYLPSEKESRNYSRGYAQVTISVVRTRIPLKWELSPNIVVIYPQPLPAALFCATLAAPDKFPDNEGSYTYNPREGSVLMAGEHSLSCQFTPFNAVKYFPSFARQSVIVEQARSGIKWIQPVPIPAGDPLGASALCATNEAGLNGQYVYDPPAGSVLTEGEHLLTVRFLPDDPNYMPTDGTVRMRVYPKRQLKMQWFDPEPIQFPCALSKQQLNASLCGFGMHAQGTYTYNPDFGTILAAGKHMLHCRFEPVRQSFLPAEASVEIEVRPCTVRVLWRTPDPLLHGEGLFDSVLNCQVSYPHNVRITTLGEGYIPDEHGLPVLTGHFEYSPPAGTLLEPGVHRLKTKFIPDDPRSYLPAFAQVEIIIRERPKFRSKLRWPILDEPLEDEQPSALLEPHALSFLLPPNNGMNNSTGTGSLNASRAATKLKKRLQMAKDADDAGDQACDRVVRVLVYGQPLDADLLCATCTNAQGRFNYRPPLETVLPVGEHVIEAAFVPDAMLSPLALPSTLVAKIRVTQRTPVLDWKLHTENGDIPYGVPLDRDYRRAQAVFAEKDKRPVPGVYLYSPPIGTVLDAGPRTISIRFEPHDAVNFSSVNAVKEVFVHRCIPRIFWEAPTKPLVFPLARLSLPAACSVDAPSASTALLAWPRAVNDEMPDAAPLEGAWEFSFASGEPLPAGDHEVTCKFNPFELINYYASNASIRLRVLPAVPAIVWSPEEVLDYEVPLSAERHCCAVSDVTGILTYDPPVGTVMAASGKALVSLSFVPDDTRNYQALSLVKRLEVRQRVAVIHWPLPRRMAFGTVVSCDMLDATLSLDENSHTTLTNLEGSSFLYTPALGEIPKAGTHVRFYARMVPPEAWRRDYAVVEKMVEVEVYRAAPPISWRPNTTSLFEGEPLLARHLCAYVGASREQRPKAQAVFPGTLVYSPPLGTVLPPGRHPVTVTFIPVEPENALSTTQTLNFDVTKRAPKISWTKDPLTGKMVCVKL